MACSHVRYFHFCMDFIHILHHSHNIICQSSFYSSVILEQGQKVNVPHLLLSQFQWLDRIVNSKVI